MKKLDLEKSIIALLLNEPQLIPIAASKIEEKDFSPKNKKLINSILNANLRDDALETKAKLIAEFKLIGANVLELLNLYNDELVGSEYLLNNLILKLTNENLRTTLHHKLQETIKILNDAEDSYHVAFNLREEIDKITEKKSTFEIKSFTDSVPEILETINKEIFDKNENVLTSKCLPSINTATGGIRTGNLIGIAGSWKSGKTTLAANLLYDFAQQGLPTLLFSLEISLSETQRKILAMETKISYENLRNPKRLTDEERKILTRYFARSKNKPLPIFPISGRFSISQIRGYIKNIKDRFGIKIAAIDYIGLISSTYGIDRRERELAYFSETLKGVATEFDMAIFLLAQLNRAGKNDPSSINLAESVALARDCDFLFTVSNPHSNNFSSVDFGGNIIQIEENHFLIKLDSSRHTQQGKQFLARLDKDGNLVEIATQYNNVYNQPEELPL